MKQQEEKQQETLAIDIEVLLVEDEAICRRVAKEYLSILGYSVDIAIDATTAIKKLRKKAYSLIVVDLRLPDKPGGEVIKSARKYEINQTTPVIVASAQINKKCFKTYLSLGADAALIKPYSLEELKKAIAFGSRIPIWQRKFFYQLRHWFNEVSILYYKIHLTSKDFYHLVDDVSVLTNRMEAMLEEYRYWSKFEKSREGYSNGAY